MLLKTRAQLEHAMKETEHPLRVNSENIYTRWSTYICQNLTFEIKTVMSREGRMGIDRVSDAVEANLHSEVTLYYILHCSHHQDHYHPDPYNHHHNHHNEHHNHNDVASIAAG